MQKWLLDITFLYEFKLAQLCLVLHLISSEAS